MKAKGAAAYKKYLRGEEISMQDAIEAKCYECMGGYADGRLDCEGTTCSLYSHMPYRCRIEEKNSGQDSQCLA
jgi:hypothetical protein